MKDSHEESLVRTKLESIFWAAIEAADPRKAVAGQADYIRHKFTQGKFKRLVPIAFGKAACPMAQGLYDSFRDFTAPGIVVMKSGHGVSVEMPPGSALLEAEHPIPDKNSLTAARSVMELAEKHRHDSLIVPLISGGGSSLLALPAQGVSLEEKQCTVDLLLKAGASIDELNCVRKHISGIKGGRMAAMLHPTPIVSLIISDVIGDRLDVIASGPTAPDSSTFRDACDVLEKYALSDRVPISVGKALRDGVQGVLPETPKKGDAVFDNVENTVVVNNGTALAAAARKARDLGFQAHVLSSDLQGNAPEAGRRLARRILAQGIPRPVCLLSGGETTVKVQGHGIGGRNMELALAFALEIEGVEAMYLLSAGTDGDDNATGAAGAFVDGSTLNRARTRGLDPHRFLENNDSYTFFKELDDLFLTGPTGTNVMDIQVVLLCDPGSGL